MTNTKRNLNTNCITFTFPTYQALWQFMEETKAIHVHIEPRKHKISGPFDEKDIDLALQFNAERVSDHQHADMML